MKWATLSGIIATLVLIAVFVLALVGQMTWQMAALIGGLAIAMLISGCCTTG